MELAKAKKKSDYAQIESDMIKLNQTMTILQELIREQQAPIDSLESFIAESKQETAQAHVALETTEDYRSMNRYIQLVAGSLFATMVYLFL